MRFLTKYLACLAWACAFSGASAQTWSTYTQTGGNANVAPAAMAEDGDGYIYVVGTTPGSNKNINVMKFNTSGTRVASQDIGGSELEEGYDITIGPDGNVYVLGKYKDITNSYKPKLYVLCLNTSLSTSWSYQVTAYEPNGSTETNEILPYRISVGGTSGSPLVYVSAQVNDTGLETGIDLRDPTHAKAVFYAKLTSGGVSWYGTWDGNAGKPDQLFGCHAMSNGLMLVTGTVVTVGGNDYNRATYTKIGSGGSVSWSTTPTITTPTNGAHVLAQSVAHGDDVYTSFQLIPVFPDLHVYDMVIGTDGSATSTPSTWTLSAYERYYSTTPGQLYTNIGLGVAYWSNQFLGVGRGLLTPGGSSSSPWDTTEYSSWLRDMSNSIIDDGVDTSYSNTARRYEPEPVANQRGLDAYNGRLLGLGRGVSSTSFWTLTYKSGSGRAEGVTNLAFGYSTAVMNPGPVQVLASKVSNSVYYLLDVQDMSTEKVALYKFDR